MHMLREITPDDKEMILRWRNMPEVSKYMYTDHYITREEHEMWFEKILQYSPSRYFIIVCDQKDVGLVNIYDLCNLHSRCYWAFYIADNSARGKGVGSFVEYSMLKYVFSDLSFNKLCCEVLAFNEAVIGMHKNFGFKVEGLFRQHIKKGAVYHDVVTLSMLKEEWNNTKSEIENKLRSKGLL